jgi:molecular chaperone DnaK
VKGRWRATTGPWKISSHRPAACARGIPQIEVTFDIDANGILHVSAKDQATGQEQSIRITASTGLSEEEIKKMVRDSEAHAEEDKKKKEEINQKNQLDNIIYQTEKTINDNKDKVSAEDIKLSKKH